MNPLAALPAVGWLTRDTFRQARASGVLGLMLAVTLAGVALCLTAMIDAPADGPPRLEAAFGAVQVPLDHGRAAAVRALEGYLAAWGGDALGLLLALLWTAGFLPAFLDEAAAPVLLAKPAPRWGLLAGKCLAAVAFVAVQDALFVFGTWLALGLRTGVWDAAYLLCLPLLVLHFAVFFGFSALLATATRSTVACAFGSVLFWLLCWAMNLGRHAFVLLPDLQSAAAGLGFGVELGYWVLPKPLDFHLVLLGTPGADAPQSGFLDVQALAGRGAWRPAASLLASCACAVVLWALAAYDFVTAEY